MKTFWIGLLGFLFLASPSFAQAPLAAGYSPVFKVGAGYSYANVGVPSRGRLNMNGAFANGTLDLKFRLGIEADFSYVRAPHVFGTSHSADLMTFMGGPVFYLKRGKHLDIYAHGLFGGARETGVNFATDGGLLLGFATKFAWAAGGGAEYKIDQNLAVRFGGDYLSTQFFDPNINFQRQQNVQAFVGVSYRFGGRRP